MFEYLLILFISPIILLFFFVVPQYIWSIFKKPENSFDFNKLFEKIPEISILYKNQNDAQIFIKNFRDAKYFKNEWDNKIEWGNKKFSTNELSSIDIFVDKYAHFQSHIILVFNFVDDLNFCKKMCVSFEIRKKNPEEFSVWQAMYKNFEVGYIVGSFEDLVGVRFLRYANFDLKNLKQNYKNLNIYKTNFTKKECLIILESLISDLNTYTHKPKFYNFIYRNCLSEILKHFKTTRRFKFSFLKILFLKKLLISQNIIN